MAQNEYLDRKPMFNSEIPSNIDQLLNKSRNKFNYKKRLEAISELGNWNCPQSKKRLYELMKYDKVYSVQQSSFLILQKFGESVKLPKKKKGHLINDINK